MVSDLLRAEVEGRKLTDDELMSFPHLPRFLEEVLRYESPVQLTFRMAMSDVELSGTKARRCRRGAWRWASSRPTNLDERVFEQPERFLPGREKGTQHLTFGQGMHFCLGAQLARMEARLALEALVPRSRELKLRSLEVEWLPGYAIHGPRVLPVELVLA